MRSSESISAELYRTVEQKVAKIKTENNIKREQAVPALLNNAPQMCARHAAQTVKAVFRKEACSRRGPAWPFKQAACGCGPRTASATFP